MVETIRLESGHTLTGIGGSNPSLSARQQSRELFADSRKIPRFWAFLPISKLQMGPGATANSPSSSYKPNRWSLSTSGAAA